MKTRPPTRPSTVALRHSRSEDRRLALRGKLVTAAFFLALITVAARAVWLQAIRGPDLALRAASQHKQQMVVQAERGAIYDRNHLPLAMSVDTVSVAAHPQRVGNARQAAGRLAPVLGVDRSRLARRLASDQGFVWLKRQAPPAIAAKAAALGIEGVVFVPEKTRVYPNKTLAGQLLGFVGVDGHGLEGLEYQFDKPLSGMRQTFTVWRDGRRKGFDAEPVAAARRSGNDLVLTIDGRIQAIAEAAIAKAGSEFQARSAMAVVMEPSTGQVLAMAHWPPFNPNAFTRYADRRWLWRNRAVTDPFEPGSTMKIFTAAAALENGLSRPNDIFFCENGRLQVGRASIHDTKPYGWLSLQQIIKYSSNIGIYKLAQRLGPRRLYATLRNFGFGAKTGVGLPGERTGLMEPLEKVNAFEAGSMAFGQGLSVTAIQLIAAASALANDGILMQPTIVKAVLSPSGRPLQAVAPRPLRRVVSATTAATMRRILATVITEGGTGTAAAAEGYRVCGKTGTAQKFVDGRYAPDRFVASFVGFAPADRPRISVLVVVDEPSAAHYGGTVAAPAFRQIVTETMAYLGIAPTGGRQVVTAHRATGGSG